MRAFLSHLVTIDRVAPWTQNQALAALTFLYRTVIGQPLPRINGMAPVEHDRHVPVVLSQQEIRAVLDHAAGHARLCIALMYGSRLRVEECVSLRVKDVDLERCEIVVRDGKGNKDRRTPLAVSSVQPLTAYLREGRLRHVRDGRLVFPHECRQVVYAAFVICCSVISCCS